MSPIQTNSPAKRAPVSIAEDTTGSRNRSYPVRQPTWEPHTSPPRIRNRHFAFTTTSPKKQQYSKVKFMLEERKEQKHDNNEVQEKRLYNGENRGTHSDMLGISSSTTSFLFISSR